MIKRHFHMPISMRMGWSFPKISFHFPRHSCSLCIT